jgi:hypothetical protein
MICQICGKWIPDKKTCDCKWIGGKFPISNAEREMCDKLYRGIRDSRLCYWSEPPTYTELLKIVRMFQPAGESRALS